MLERFKKMWPATAASLVLSLTGATSSLMAADSSDSAQIRSLENRVNALEQRRSSSTVLPSAQPTLQDAIDFGLGVDVYYMWSSEMPSGGVTYSAMTGSSLTGLPSAISVAEADPHGNWGVSVYALYDTDYDALQLKLNWDYLESKQHINSTAAMPAGIAPTVLPPYSGTGVLSGDFYGQVESSFHVKKNVGSIQTLRESYISKYLVFAPSFGFTGYWLNMKGAYNYSNLSPVESWNVATKDDYWGLGPRMGATTSLYFNSNFFLFGSLAFTPLYGKHNVERTDLANATQASMTTQKRYGINTNYESEIGLGAQGSFDEDRYAVRFSLAWRLEYMPNMYIVPVPSGIATGSAAGAVNPLVDVKGDYAVQGIRAGLSLSF